MCDQKGLARVSKTPGRTQLINFFDLPDGNRLVDLPGYGYAKVPERLKLEWQQFIESYMTERTTLAGLVIIMDIRHPMRDYDHIMLSWAESRQLPTHIILNKSDKLKHGAVSRTVLETRKALKEYDLPTSVQAFSSLKKIGVSDLGAQLTSWLNKDEIEAEAE